MFVLTVATSVYGRTVLRVETFQINEDADDVRDTIADDISIADINDWLQDADEISKGDILEIGSVLERGQDSLEGCSGGRCEICFKVWKLQGCFIVTMLSGAIEIKVEAYGKTLYTHEMRTDGSYTIRISKDKLPNFLKKVLESDISVEISGVDLTAKKMCVQVETRVKWVGTVRWPKSSPHCFHL